jgi:bacillithiol synthase
LVLRVRGVTTMLGGARRTELDLEVHAETLQGGRLLDDYLAGHQNIRPYFTGHPGDIDAYRRKAAEVGSRLSGAARAALAAAIEPLGDAAPKLKRILTGDGFFVTTGQQPALFGGPLYTLYKALAAIRTAELLEARLGQPVLALFWVGADDHDWEEANHVSVLDGRGYLQRLSVAGEPDAPPLPLSQRRWGRGILSAVEELSKLLPETPHGRQLRQHLHAAYTPDATVEASFTSTLRLLLHDRQIALMSSAHPALRRAAVPVLRYEATHTSEHFEHVRRQTGRVEADGYPVQVALTPDASNLMQMDEGGRNRLLHTPLGWVARGARRAVSDEQLLARIESEPERFSPNVLLRPVVETAVLPTLAYVAGPGELRYFAQIGCLFEAHGLLPPVVVPRPGVTLVEPRVRRLLDRLGLEHTAFRQPFDELLASLAARDVPPSAHDALARIRDSLVEAYDELVEAAGAVDPTLRGPLTAARNRSLMAARDAERRILRHLKRRDATRTEQLARAAASLQPGGTPQERVLSPLPFVARYGPALVELIEESLDPLPAAAASWRGPSCD